MRYSNLGSVARFEFTRTVKKRSFWIITLIVPLVMAVVIMLLTISNASSDSAAAAQKDAKIHFAYIDMSGVVNSSIAEQLGGHLVSDAAVATNAVKDGTLEAFILFSTHPSSENSTIVAKDLGVFGNGRYAAVAQVVLNASVTAAIANPEAARINVGSPAFVTTAYKDGKQMGGINAIVIPLAFVLLFYIAVLLLGNQMLNIAVEEKENRVAEMLLTTVSPRTLILGKVVGVAGVGLLQQVIFLALPIIGYFVLRDKVAIPGLDLNHLSADPGQVAIAVLLFLGGLWLFTACLVAAGAVMPTAKDAGAVFGIVIACLFIPFYAISLMVTNPSSLLVQFFTFFPLTAPVTAMARNGLGNLPVLDAVIVILALFGAGTAVMALAVRLFKTGIISYSKRVDIRSAFSRN